MRRARGFTLIELVVVFSIISLLLTIALPRYFASLERSREVVLRENLNQMRDAISRYHADKGRYPDSLETLAAERYLRGVPLDPLTESNATWLIVQPAGGHKGAVYDVRSGAPGRAPDGSEYLQW